MNQFVQYEYGAGAAILISAVWMLIEFFKKR
jgi:hypothetical protein